MRFTSLNIQIILFLIIGSFSMGQLLRGVTEKENWHDWVMYLLTALIETAQLTTKKIRAMLSLKEVYEKQMKQALGSSFSYELLQLLFTIPYLKIELPEKRKIAVAKLPLCGLRN